MNVEDIKDLEERITYSLGAVDFQMDFTEMEDVTKIKIEYVPKEAIKKFTHKITILPSGKSRTSTTRDLF